jgi:hypothetical protein
MVDGNRKPNIPAKARPSSLTKTLIILTQTVENLYTAMADPYIWASDADVVPKPN